ncbi:MAG TPA: MFS transporter [Chloroflexia bacterium]|nr:MFS transporter [Chloroflexia bacterium]
MDQSATDGPVLGTRALLRIRDFRLLWLAQVISDFGDSLTNLALLIFVNQVTGSTAAIATMAIVLGVPQVTFGLLAGVYVDRLDRRRIMRGADGLRGLLVLGFVAASLTQQLPLLYLIGFVQASIGAFFTPARGALLPALVPRGGLMAANGLSQMSRIIAGVAGTAAAGLLVGALGTFWPAFLIDALTFFVSVALVGCIRARVATPVSTGRGTPRAIFTQLGEGLQTIGRSRILLGTLLALAITMLGLGAVNVLVVPLILNDLRVPATWFGAVELAQAASMVLSGSLVAVLAARLAPARIVSVGLLLIGALTALIGLSGSIWHLLVILFAVGWVMTPLQAAIATIMQTGVEDRLRGRIGAALSTVVSSASLLSMALAGGFGEWVGPRNVFLLAGGVTVLAAILAAAMLGARRAAAPAAAAEAVLT